mmetsp:Transcript_3904/g.9539  ORF Transcript_3904/g.9539 Transcript_3904/m.9539 type:complete len:328 (-) Transcript_3904:282-1265(-)
MHRRCGVEESNRNHAYHARNDKVSVGETPLREDGDANRRNQRGDCHREDEQTHLDQCKVHLAHQQRLQSDDQRAEGHLDQEQASREESHKSPHHRRAVNRDGFSTVHHLILSIPNSSSILIALQVNITAKFFECHDDDNQTCESHVDRDQDRQVQLVDLDVSDDVPGVLRVRCQTTEERDERGENGTQQRGDRGERHGTCFLLNIGDGEDVRGTHSSLSQRHSAEKVGHQEEPTVVGEGHDRKADQTANGLEEDGFLGLATARLPETEERRKDDRRDGVDDQDQRVVEKVIGVLVHPVLAGKVEEENWIHLQVANNDEKHHHVNHID